MIIKMITEGSRLRAQCTAGLGVYRLVYGGSQSDGAHNDDDTDMFICFPSIYFLAEGNVNRENYNPVVSENSTKQGEIGL